MKDSDYIQGINRLVSPLNAIAVCLFEGKCNAKLLMQLILDDRFELYALS